MTMLAHPTGVLLENAMQLIGSLRERQEQQRSPAQTQADLLETIRLAGDECLRHGIPVSVTPEHHSQ